VAARLKRTAPNGKLRYSPRNARQAAQRLEPKPVRWVSANAGSGKTYVLASRVVRLLLQGVAPSKILCLTFTKAAAANMASGVFDKLARWTQLADDELIGEIVAAGAAAPDSRGLIAARKLFARTLETPGGLKIQTIHAFCERLLHLFRSRPMFHRVSKSWTKRIKRNS